MGVTKTLAFLVLAVALIFLDFRYPQYLTRVRVWSETVFYPMLKIVDWPFRAASWAKQYFVTHNNLVSTNRAYKQELLILHGKLLRLQALETENAELRNLKQVASQFSTKIMLANIMNVVPDPFTRQIILDKGENDGVYVGQVVLDSDGIMGTVVSVFNGSSRAILITDVAHAIPVTNNRNGLRAIAVGSADGSLQLRHVPHNADLEVGDLLLSSGLGGRFPVGFPVGVVTKLRSEKAENFKTIELEPSAQLDRGSHVLLLQDATLKPNKVQN